ncbi:MAG: LPS assembly lipoprotein LptE [Bacteroidota bacterium]|nr:LPS assembly lipoprotein LptE [Bacteroidota bacterium]MDX5430022.1 LPS assembly lipoprotein LptE [Bacteroidota bacterium]MDX5468792.1 LPS assembly lipoprotein LptE [Bacteroidota bacterium]
MKLRLMTILGVVLMLPMACKVNYSFSGAQTGTAETVSVAYFTNVAPLNNPALSQVFTEKMKDKFVRETPLKLVDSEGDMMLSGKIIDYNVSPVAIQQNVTAAQNRLTITIQVKFVNKTDSKYDFEKTFTNFEDFDATKSLNSVEGDLVNAICDKIVQNVFNDAVINW